MENQYEKVIHETLNVSNNNLIELSLPIKTKDGVVLSRAHEGLKESRRCNKSKKQIIKAKSKYHRSSKNEVILTQVISQPITMVKLLANREQRLRLIRLRIGILCNEILENPTQQIHNILILLNFMEDKNPEFYITIRKIATVSLLEIFQDLLPDYKVWIIEKQNMKLKKETIQLQRYEQSILVYYKRYLQNLESMSKILKNKAHALHIKPRDSYLGLLAIRCLSDLLLSRPYFNFASNIAKFLVPFMQNNNKKIRQLVSKGLREILRADKYGEISLIILRSLNQYIKTRNHLVHSNIVAILQDIQIENMNMDKHNETKEKTVHCRKRKLICLNKKESQRKHSLEKIKTDMLETKATVDANRTTEKVFTEIINLLFTIYLRILKQHPKRKLLSLSFEGLSKLSPYLSINLHQMIVRVLEKLISKKNALVSDRLHCIYTIFIILSSRGSDVNIDPLRFYNYLYKMLTEIHIGKDADELDMSMKILIKLILFEYRNLNQNRVLAFIKKVSLVALNVHHPYALGILSMITFFKLNCKNINRLFDTSSIDIVLNSMDSINLEYNNTSCLIKLWEIIAVQRHYHIPVRNYAKSMVLKLSKNNQKYVSCTSKSFPEEIFHRYDSSKGIFNPAIPVPNKIINRSVKDRFLTNEFNKIIERLEY